MNFFSFDQNLSLFIHLCDYCGTFAFAISGIRLAAAQKFDWFGAFVLGFVTAVGGGTIRDILLDSDIFWLKEPSYLTITLVALLTTIIFKKKLVRLDNTVYFFDALGIGLFTAVGVAKSFSMGYPWWIAPIMGTITGSFGGILRDVFLNKVPLVFRSDFYATACLSGGIIYVALKFLGLPLLWVQGACAASVFILRILTAYFHWKIPEVNWENFSSKNSDSELDE